MVMAGIVRRIVQCTTCPQAIGPYSQAVIAGNTMYISGQLGLTPGSKTVVDGGVEAQTEQALKNMGEILKSQGIDFNNVVKCTVLMADLNEFQRMNGVYAKFFPTKHPARAAYQVARLPLSSQQSIQPEQPTKLLVCLWMQL